MKKKLNDKGLTVIEILVCFSIVVVIVMSMFKVVNNQKSKQEIESAKNSMLTYKNEVTKTIEEDIIKYGGISNVEITPAENDNPYIITYQLNNRPLSIKIYQNSKCDENSEEKDVEDYDKAAIDCRSTNYISYYIGNNLIEKFEIPDIYTLRFNDVQISKQNNYLKIYVGFIHNDLGTRYSALDIVVPINKNWY